jgi:phosphoglycerate-specific signal transduction histidine kinase
MSTVIEALKAIESILERLGNAEKAIRRMITTLKTEEELEPEDVNTFIETYFYVLETFKRSYETAIVEPSLLYQRPPPEKLEDIFMTIHDILNEYDKVMLQYPVKTREKQAELLASFLKSIKEKTQKIEKEIEELQKEITEEETTTEF